MRKQKENASRRRSRKRKATDIAGQSESQAIEMYEVRNRRSNIIEGVIKREGRTGNK